MKEQISIYKKISKLSDGKFSPDLIETIKKGIAKNTDDIELSMFITTCKDVGLNPLIKEIWCYKDHQGNLIMFAGRDGFLKKAQESSRWNGIASSEIRENDFFEADIPNGIIEHKFGFKDRGKIIGAYAICKPKGCDIATIEVADFSTYDKGNYVWKSHPADMIKKVAEIKVLKKAYGISGLQSEFEFNISNERAYPIDTENKIENSKIIFAENLINSSTLHPEIKENYLQELLRDDLTETELNELIKELSDIQPNKIQSGEPYNMKDIQKELDLKMNDSKS